jgi:hypothetical protein
MRPLEQVLWQTFTWFGLLVIVLMVLAIPLFLQSSPDANAALIPATGDSRENPAAGGYGTCIEVLSGGSSAEKTCSEPLLAH